MIRLFRKARWLLALAALIAAALFGRLPDPEKVTGFARIIDGDSLEIGGVDIRLQGVDAPELAQTCSRRGETYACGETARAALQRRAREGALTCELGKQDKYRRSLGRCFADDDDLGAWLVRRGYAVSYGSDYKAEEERARRERAGLWAGSFEEPAAWRKAHRRGLADDEFFRLTTTC